MNDPTKHQTQADDDELPELGRAVDRHFFRAKVIISALAVAATVGMALVNLVDNIQRDIQQHRVDVERDIGALKAIVKGNADTLHERGIRIGNLEEKVYELRNKPSSRPDPFTGTEGRALEQRIQELEYQTSQPQLKERMDNVEKRP
jgi:hypothetical protein